MFLQGHEICYYLTGMRKIRKAVDHRNGSFLCQCQQFIMTKGAYHYRIYHTRKNLCRISNALTPAKLHVV